MKNAEIKELRKRLKLTQKGLAARLRIDAIAVSRWEHNEQRPSALAERQLARLTSKMAKH